MQSENIIADTVGNCTPELQNSVKFRSFFPSAAVGDALDPEGRPDRPPTACHVGNRRDGLGAAA